VIVAEPPDEVFWEVTCKFDIAEAKVRKKRTLGGKKVRKRTVCAKKIRMST